MADLRKLKDEAAEHAARGRHARAAELLAAVVRADPRDVGSRRQLGDELRRAGETAEAVRVYRDVAERYARDGQPVKAIAICKVLLEADPRHEATQRLLAELYAQRRGGAPRRAPPAAPEEPEVRVELPLPPRPAAAPEPPAGPATAAARAAPPVAPPGPASGAATPFEEILEAARSGVEEGVELVVGEEPQAAPAPSSPAVELPRIPLFSDLPREAFVTLAERVALHRVAEGTAIVREGEAGTSLFVLASGTARVERAGPGGVPVLLARLPAGSFFGEMAILSGEPRSATVVAEEPAEVLEIAAGVLLDLAREHPAVVESLGAFYRRRLLANAMATSPIFRPFDRAERTALMERFRCREVAAGAVVVAEGEPADGLYVVLSGALDVWKRRDGGPARAARLREGDLFGETSCLRKGPASASVVAARPCLLLRLPRADFDALVLSHPQILEALAELDEERQHGLAAVAAGRAAFDDEGLLLT